MSITKLILEKNFVEAKKALDEKIIENLMALVEEKKPVIASKLFGEETVIHPPKKDKDEDEEDKKFTDQDGDGVVNQFDNDDDGDGIHDDDEINDQENDIATGADVVRDDEIAPDETQMKGRGNKVTVTIETQ